MERDLTRRSFLFASALGAGTLAGASLLGGCASNKEARAMPGEGGSSAEMTYAREESCDVVVVGTGTAGTFAAVRAADLGAKVICLEKKGSRGGTSYYTEGIGAVNSAASAREGMSFDENEAYLTLMEYQDWGARDDVIWSYIENSGPALDWAESCGVAMIGSNPMAPVLTYANSATLNGEYALIGEGLHEPLWAFADSTGNVDLRLETPAVGLVVADGAVKGVYATDAKGETVKINARAVILATGGFCSNKEMFENRVQVPYDRVVFFGLDGRDGDGLRFALDAGGFVHAPAALNYTYGCVANTTNMHDVLNGYIAWEPHLQVNQNGKRFHDESLAYTDPSHRNVALLNQDVAYAIVDSDYIEAAAAAGPMNYGTGLTEGDLKEHIAGNPDIHKADTIEELASMIGIDPAALQKTADSWNAALESGSDPEFNVPAELMRPVKAAPFYAMKLMPSSYTTIGGATTDSSMRVLDGNGLPVEGLFATGCDNGSPYYRDYPMAVFGGFCQGFAATSGYVAANAACESR